MKRWRKWVGKPIFYGTFQHYFKPYPKLHWASLKSFTLIFHGPNSSSTQYITWEWNGSLERNSVNSWKLFGISRNNSYQVVRIRSNPRIILNMFKVFVSHYELCYELCRAIQNCSQLLWEGFQCVIVLPCKVPIKCQIYNLFNIDMFHWFSLLT